jgi:PAS domain S-box-containing protein
MPARYALAVLIAVVAIALKHWPGRDLQAPFILAYPAVMAAASLGGMGPGLVATVLGALGSWYWVLPPTGTFALHSMDDAASLGVFGAMGAAISVLAERFHRWRSRAESAEIARARDAAEDRFRAYFETAPDAIFVTGLDRRIEEVNPAALRLLGADLASLKGRSIEELLLEGDREAFRKRFEKAVAGSVVDDELQAVVRDGCRVWVRSLAARLPGDRVIAFARDITDRRRMVQELRISEKRHRLLAENASDVVWTMAPDGRVTYVSPAVEDMRGYTVAEAMAQPLEEIHPPSSAAVSQAYFVKLLGDLQAGRTPEPFRGELEYRCKDGSTVWTEVLAFPILGPDGQLVELLGVSRDIQARKRAEDALRRSEARFRALAEFSPVGIFETDAQGRHVYVNGAGARVIGIPPEAFHTAGWASTLHPDDRERAIREWRAAVAAGMPLVTEARFRPPDGRTTTVKVFVDAIRGAGGGVSGYVGVMVDVTEQRAAEQHLAAASRLAALGTLVAGVGHEINNPLAAAMANDDDVVSTLRRLVALVQGEAPLDRARIGDELAEALESAGFALEADQRIARIVKDLVSLGRGGGRRERVQLREVAEAAIRWLPPAARAGASIEVEDLKAPEVMGRAGQLAQVVLNLVSNASRAGRDGKPPSITVRLSPGRGGGA